MKKLLLTLAASTFVLAVVRAAEPDTADRGPFFSGTIRAKFPGDNVAMKGIVVTLGAEKNAFICYDTDLMRVSLGWTGGYLNFGNYMKEISHPQPPEVAGTPSFGTKPGPGWAHDGSFADPRPNRQGPLPADWAKYRGLYLHDRQVILSYTINGTGVLEMPGAQEQAGLKLFTRTIQMEKPSRMTLLVCDGLPDGMSGHGQGERAVVVADYKGPQGAERFGAALLGAPEASIESTNGRLVVILSGKEKPGASFQVVMWSGMAGEGSKFVQAVRALRDPPRLRPLTKGGPARWKEPVETKGSLATSGGDGPYVVDTLGENLTNRWGTRAFFGGFDFFPDGRAAVCTFHGDVWIVSGIDDKLEKLAWRRFATGIFQGLGLKVVDGKVYVLGRDQITRLHDLNNDGEADFYENFNNDTVATANYHEFCLDLHTDSKGSFYFFKSSPWTPDVKSPHQGTLLKVSKDGAKMEVFATGFRAPNGSAIGPHDEITVSDNQGHWMPASKLNLVRKGGFYGMMPAAQHELTLARNGTNLTLNPSDPQARAAFKVPAIDAAAPIPITYDQPICWLPMGTDNSSGGQVWVTGDKWGPLKNHLLFMSYGRGTLFHVMQEEVDGVTQAAMVKFPLKFGTGLMRGRMNPKDGQVYVSGLRGWQTDGQKDGGFYRVRYTGKPVHTPVEFHVLKDGLRIVFPNPLDAASATDVANYFVEEWNYTYTGNYGSPERSVSDPKNKNHDTMELKSARLSEDGRTVFLEIPDLRPVNQMRIKLNLKAADGTPITQEIYNTIHKTGSASVAANQSAPKPKAESYLTVETAGRDYADQGEYLNDWGGAQVIALGDDKFRLVSYKGGLPGAGWDKVTKSQAEGKRDGDKIVFTGTNDYKVELAAGTITIHTADGGPWTMKKTTRISPTMGAKPSAGATVLFDIGKGADEFAGGHIDDRGLLAAGCSTKRRFQNFSMHCEFLLPFKPLGRGQDRGNSGVYMQDRYEVQVLDSFGLGGENNECGGIYTKAKPAVNMCFPPLVWQTYDIDFTAAQFDPDGKKSKNAIVTVKHNGVLIHDKFEIPGTTGGGKPEGPAPGPIQLQGHGNPVFYRNVWVVEK